MAKKELHLPQQQYSCFPAISDKGWTGEEEEDGRIRSEVGAVTFSSYVRAQIREMTPVRNGISAHPTNRSTTPVTTTMRVLTLLAAATLSTAFVLPSSLSFGIQKADDTPVKTTEGWSWVDCGTFAPTPVVVHTAHYIRSVRSS